MNHLKHGTIAVGAPGSEARLNAEIEDAKQFLETKGYTVTKVSEETRRLIEAAPEMLTALKRAVDWADPTSENFSKDSMAAIVDQINDVIEKADGK